MIKRKEEIYINKMEPPSATHNFLGPLRPPDTTKFSGAKICKY